MKLTTLIFLSLLFTPLLSGAANSQQDNLQQHLRNSSHLSGQFTQVVENSESFQIQSSTGEFWINKPNQFRWHYATPYVQKIISNGDKVWIYDEDLEQVSIKDASTAIQSSPLSIILGSTSIEQHFNVTGLTKKDALEWLKLTPKSDSSGFEFIHVGFDKGMLSRMELQDNFGQTTRLLFTNIDKTSMIDNSTFNFQVPEGSDVFDETIEQ